MLYCCTLFVVAQIYQHRSHEAFLGIEIITYKLKAAK